ncbi:hypothetical protein [Saccharopolyspora shandongensis]|uniref:hypothetical protein n=1 Tax=Saccharopolyspora shandongensis TaxID=418495 RepID=UPI0033CEA91F
MTCADVVFGAHRVFAVDGTPAVLMRDHARTRYQDQELDPHPLSDVDVDLITPIREAGAPLSRREGHLDAVETSAARLLATEEGRPLVCLTQTCLSNRGGVLLLVVTTRSAIMAAQPNVKFATRSRWWLSTGVNFHWCLLSCCPSLSSSR